MLKFPKFFNKYICSLKKKKKKKKKNSSQKKYTNSQTDKQKYLVSSVQFSCSVVFNSLWSHGLQHARLPCPSPTPRVCWNSCPSSQWCHPTVLSSVVPFSCLQSCPASGSFPMSQFLPSEGQSIEVSISASVLPMNIQDWFPLGWTPSSPRDSQESSPTL